MGPWLKKRVLALIPTLLGVTLLTFLLFHVFAGDPVLSFLGKGASAKEVAELRALHGLDRPLWAQYLLYLGEIARLDFGRSFVTHEPVTAMLWAGLGPTLSLTGPALLLTHALSLVVALAATHLRGRPLDRALVVLTVLGMSLSFLAYVVLGQWLLAYVWPVFHIHGYEPGWVERWPYLGLPILILVLVGAGYDTRYYRAVLVAEAGKDYALFARAKGASRLRGLLSHVLPNALVPITTRVMISLPFLISGSVLLESFFGIPGLGMLLYTALDRADFPLIKAYTLLLSLLFVASNLLTDLLYARWDPRVELS